MPDVSDIAATRRAAWPRKSAAYDSADPSRLGVTRDVVAMQVVARLRVAVAIALAAAASFVPVLERHSLLFVVLGLLWVPWASAVLFAADDPDRRLARIGGPVGDVVVLFAIQAFVPGSESAALLGYLLVVAFTVYSARRATASLLGASVLVAATAAHQIGTPGSRVGTAVMVPFSAGLVGLVLLLDRTVTLQREATARSQRLQSQADVILARVADGVVVTDASGRVLQSNPAAQRIMGPGHADRPGGHCSEILGLRRGDKPLDCSNGCPLLAATEDGDEFDGVQGEEVWRQDGTRRQPLLASVAPVVDGDGRILEVVHSLRDITRFKQAEEAKTLFLATASHELKTPLTVINGFADTLLRYDDLDAAKTRQAVESIHRRGRELSRIVDRLLLSSRIEAGRAEVNVEAVDVATILEERVQAVRDITGRDITLDTAQQLPRSQADPAAFTAVIDQLLENAVKYSPDGGPIRVRVNAANAPRSVEIEVQDEGIGMDSEQASQCFDKFWQAETTDVRRFNGTGIGLYIVRSLVEAMGGEVQVRSERGRGSTFSVKLLRPETKADTSVGESTSIREFMRQIGVPERKPR